MSRTYKRNIVKSDGPNWRRFSKRQANKAVRRAINVPDGKAYRRIYNPWDICDWTMDMRFDRELSWYRNRVRFFRNSQWYYRT